MAVTFQMRTFPDKGELVQVFGGNIWYEGRQMPVESVRAIAFGSSFTNAPLAATNEAYCILRSETDDMKIVDSRTFMFRNPGENNVSQIAEALAQISAQSVLDYCFNRVILAGFKLRIGKFLLTRTGIEYRGAIRRKFAPWQFHPTVESGLTKHTLSKTRYGVSQVVAFDPSKGKKMILGTFTAQDFNGIYLPTILDLCKRQFG